MVNPFREFSGYQERRKGKELPLDRILAAKDLVLEQLGIRYHRVIGEEVLNVDWREDHSSLPQVYAAAEQATAELRFTVEDIEDFCYVLEDGEHFPPALAGPAGLYLSAMCNQVAGAEIFLRLKGLKSRVHLLGYRLPAGKRLVVEGGCGDLTGAEMAGGEILVQGSTGNWTGRGMKQGMLIIEGNTGERTGERMEGGEVRVKGRIYGLGQVQGGAVYLRDYCVAPRRESV